VRDIADRQSAQTQQQAARCRSQTNKAGPFGQVQVAVEKLPFPKTLRNFRGRGMSDRPRQGHAHHDSQHDQTQDRSFRPEPVGTKGPQ